jgi:alpha-ketoglutarate-dependent taurine dioxygenase
LALALPAESATIADGYSRWRDAKLAAYPARVDELIVEVRDPRQLSPAEKSAIAERVRRANMAVYASRCGSEEDRAIPAALGRQFGLHRLDANWLADEDGISSIAVREGPQRGEFIPYTSRPIGWHTDGYYNAPEQRIRAFVLHCVRPAAEGGQTMLLDHEIAYLQVRDADPDALRALMQPGAMTIPGRAAADGTIERPAQSGPVFSFDATDGALHMRYTARATNIVWAADLATAAAVRLLAQRLGAEATQALRLRLESGMGVICNNVLHTRSAFRDLADTPRLLYRARYYDRIWAA